MHHPADLNPLPHICVCICTYQRPVMLQRLLLTLNDMECDGLFTFSVAVADNSPEGEAELLVDALRPELVYEIAFISEPHRNIAYARNAVISIASGDYYALIDDDELPDVRWLVDLFALCAQPEVDAVLGPVLRCFEGDAPRWLQRSSLYERITPPTGTSVAWRKSRTGNVMLRASLIGAGEKPFRPEFRAGEDQDFFRRKIEAGAKVVWSREGVVRELIPPSRWRRRYYIRKALIQGATSALQPDCTFLSLCKSVLAVVIYSVALPFVACMGQHLAMTLLVKLCDHLGKLLASCGINPIHEEYVSS